MFRLESASETKTSSAIRRVCRSSAFVRGNVGESLWGLLFAMSIVTFPVREGASLRRLLLTVLAALIAIGVIWSLAAKKVERCVTVQGAFSSKDFSKDFETSRRICDRVPLVAYFFGSAASLIDRQP